MYTLLGALLVAASTGITTPPPGSPQGVEAARRVVATLQLAVQEYRLAFAGGQLVNRAEAEEAALFVAAARQAVRELPATLGIDTEGRVAALAALIARGAPADSLALGANDIERRLTVALGTTLDDRPAREPSLENGARIFGARCAQCHGVAGFGDGEAGRLLSPAPANLADPALLAAATPLDFYRKITHGVPATGMAPYETILTREERWDVVAHVIALSDATARHGRSGQVAIVFATVRGTLGGALELAAAGSHEAAALKALDAYMAFEAVESALSATDPSLVRTAEERFFAVRTAAEGADSVALAGAHRDLLATLELAEEALTRGRSPTALFAESLLLVLREGFEAILVVGAIMAVLLKAGATERRRHVRWGVALAVLASLATAGVLEWVLLVTPAQREALEGGVMLVAAATLFYVSYWLISKIEVAAWQRFVKGRIQKAVASGSALALGGAAFLAVYREGFETVLFYKALFLAGGGAGTPSVLAGLVVGLAALVAVFFAIERFGLRIPMRPFFMVTSTMLLYMAFVFAGGGVKELQEGAYLPTTLIPGGPRSDMLGIYPTVESLGLQAVIVVALIVALVWTFVIRPRRDHAATPRVAPETEGVVPSVAPVSAVPSDTTRQRHAARV